MSGQIFISYRREESRWSAGRLYDRLVARFDRKQIFMDIDGVPIGDDFVKVIEQRVGECEVLIALIGTRWLDSTDEQNGRRLDNPEDFVRMEIATALRRDIRVIPVLVDGALMPRSTDLPDDLKTLVRRNALRVSDTGFDDDCRRLVAAIEQILERNAAERREKERLEAEARQRTGSKLTIKVAVVRLTSMILLTLCIICVTGWISEIGNPHYGFGEVLAECATSLVIGLAGVWLWKSTTRKK